jgi:hypothetical protein
MHKLVHPLNRLVPFLKEHKRPILLPHKGKMIPHIYNEKLNKVIPKT